MSAPQPGDRLRNLSSSRPGSPGRSFCLESGDLELGLEENTRIVGFGRRTPGLPFRSLPGLGRFAARGPVDRGDAGTGGGGHPALRALRVASQGSRCGNGHPRGSAHDEAAGELSRRRSRRRRQRRRDDAEVRLDRAAPQPSTPSSRRRSPAIPARRCPYLSADPKRVEHWKHVLGTGRALKVGIVWQGKPRPVVGSPPLGPSPLAVVQGASPRSKGVRLLQLCRRTSTCRSLLQGPFGYVDLGRQLATFGETAAIIKNSGPRHRRRHRRGFRLAGALGVAGLGQSSASRPIGGACFQEPLTTVLVSEHAAFPPKPVRDDWQLRRSFCGVRAAALRSVAEASRRNRLPKCAMRSCVSNDRIHRQRGDP